MFARHAILIGICLGIAIILLLEGLGLAQAPSGDTRVAVVNGETIILKEVDAAIKQRPPSLTPLTAAQMRQLRVEVATALVDDLLLRQFFRDHGPKINLADVNKQMAALETGLKAQNKTLAEYLRELNQTEALVRANLLTMLQLDHYISERTTEADMKRYYESNKDYFDKVMVRTSHIVIRVASNAAQSDRAAARQKLQALRQDIVAGRLDFAKAAQENSQCPSAPKGGDIGFIYRKFENVEEAYARAAFAMKVGEISDVVETEFGCHLIKVTERNEGKPTKYEQCVDLVRDCYAEDLRVELLNQLRKQARVQITVP